MKAPSTSSASDSICRNISPEDTVTVEVQITERDVEEMHYFLNECPMANMSVNNAVTSALRRALKPDVPVSVNFRNGQPIATLDDRECSLDPKICAWMAKSLMGWQVSPVAFRIEISKTLLPPLRRQLDLLPSSLQRRVDDAPVAVTA